MSRLGMSFTGPSIWPPSRSSTPSAVGTSGSASATEATLSDSWMQDYDVPSQGQRAPTPDADPRTGRTCCELRPNIVDSLECEPFRSPSKDASQRPPLDLVSEACQSRRSRSQRVRFESSARRMELNHRLDNLVEHLDRLQSSVELLAVQPPTKTQRARWQQLYASTDLNFEELEDQVCGLDLFAEELRDDKRRQEDAEKVFDDAVRVISAQLRASNFPPRDEASLVACAPTIVSTLGYPCDISPPIEAELEAYYAATSTLSNVGERLGELQTEQQEQWERRGVIEDQGGFLERYEILGTIYNDFTAAQTAQVELPDRETNTDWPQS